MSQKSANLSYVHGVSDTPLLGDTIGSCLDRTVEQFGTEDALIVPYQGIRWTWSELNEKVNAYAAGLIGLGLKPGRGSPELGFQTHLINRKNYRS